ncbi:MAG: branched-chain amino acid ABC transporter ATP-binding protein/permease, partial [Armatimonadota bacterium]|nr:branched-chain amino acid ABC transporter ATP-binding protein/permease [Armatimonadota bacterium]
MSARWSTLAFVALLVALPWLVAGRLSLSIFLIVALHGLIAIGLTLLGGQAGQVSLGQAAFYGVGAYISAITTLRLGLDPWVAMPLAGGGAALLAYFVGAPVLLLRGHYLVLGTLALNVIIEVVLRNWQELTGGANGLTGIPPLHLGPLGPLRGNVPYYYIAWALVLSALWLGRNLITSRTGRALAAIRASEVAAVCMGISPPRYKVRVFALSATMAALAGSVYVHYLSFVSPSPFAFEVSIGILVMSVLGGMMHLPGAVLGAALLTLLREALRSTLPQFFRGGASAEYEIVVFGLLLAAVIIFAPGGLWPYVARLGGRGPKQPVTAVEPAAAPAPQADPPSPAHGMRSGGARSRTPSDGSATELPLLRVQGLTKRFGGLVAVNHLSFDVRRGEIYGIIGPNGAGKTTAFNLISGVIRPTSGTVTFDGRRIDHLPPDQIARLGIIRTFQTPKLVPDLSVVDNVRVGLHGQLRAGFFSSMAGFNRAEEQQSLQEALALLHKVGLDRRAGDPAGALPFGDLRLVEMARALAARPRLLLLDEPASGLTAAQRAHLGQLIREIREEGITVVLVEHDVRMVMGLADRVLVLNYGERLAEDRPDDVQRDPAVIAAYLG